MAEARQATHEPQVRYQEEGTELHGHKTKVAKSVYQDFAECAFRTKKQFYNGLWPTTWDNLLAAFAGFFLLMVIDSPRLRFITYYFWLFGGFLHLDDSYPYFFRVTVICLISSLIYFICTLYLRQNLLRLLLSYKGWLYQNPKSQSTIVTLWGLLVRLTSGRKPTLYSYQSTLPRMSVPPVRETVKKLLESVKPVLDKEGFQHMELDANNFLSTIAPKLQWVLYLKSWWSPNYHSDWWEKYVYLMSRDPLAINSNYYVHDQLTWVPTKHQTSRAAGITSLILAFRSLVDSEELEPLAIRNTIPICMWQYQRMFSTARIPRTDGDIIRHHTGSEHIVVYAKGHFYKIYIDDAHGKRLNVLDWQNVFDWVLKDADTWSVKSDAELHIAALTGNNRTTWATCRREHFTSGINRNSIHAIEEAIFLVVLDDNAFADLSERVKYLLHGNGSSMWFDKSVSAVFFKDGKMGLNCEHTWGDAPVMGHLVEYYISHEYLYRIYDDDGYCKPYISPKDPNVTLVPSKGVITPMRLYWDMNADLEKTINESYLFSVKNNEDLDICLKNHDTFGKGFMKRTKNSPDAFIQMALQLAYYKDSGGIFALTYEASMTRLFLQGRTETVRSFTQEVKEFVLAMMDDEVPVKEKIRLMRVAAVKHQKLYRDGMSGEGIDRHLFALYVVCKGQGYDSPFLKNALTMPWTLSTSQVPIIQTPMGVDCNRPEVKDSLSPGGGFGPVSDKGYGVAYVILNDTMTCFHVSAKRSCDRTDAKRFMDNLYWSLSAMKELFEDLEGN